MFVTLRTIFNLVLHSIAMLKTLLSLPRTVWLIGLISFVNDAASEMLYPLMPLYLATVLMAGPKALGLIEGIAEATSSIFKLVSGVIVDRTKKTKPWIVIGYFLAGIGRPLIAIEHAFFFVCQLHDVSLNGFSGLHIHRLRS